MGNGDSSCTASIVWVVDLIVDGYLEEDGTSIVTGINADGSTPVQLTNANTVYELFDSSGTALDTEVFSGSCDTGLDWDTFMGACSQTALIPQ